MYKGRFNEIIYRIKQFYWNLNAKIDDNDIMYLNTHLDSEELKIFNNLSKSEQKHSIKVAYCIEKLYKEGQYSITKNQFIKLGLLHDIGKTSYKVNIIKKSIIVILNKVTKSRIKKLQNFKSIYIYYNHGYLGYCILKQYNKYNKEMLYLVKNHHNKNITSKELNLLRYIDDLN